MTSSAQAHRRRERRSAARLSAVQALYQMDIAGTDLNQVIHEFTKLRTARPGEAAEDPGLADLAPLDETQGEILAIGHADHTFFAELLRGVMRLQTTIDPDVDQQLARGWRLARVDSILRQTLRAALYELIERTDVPARAVINEYIEIAKAFFDGEEPRVVNGVLDTLARKYRPNEVGPKRSASSAVQQTPQPQEKTEPDEQSGAGSETQDPDALPDALPGALPGSSDASGKSGS